MGYHQLKTKETTWDKLSGPCSSNKPHIISFGFLEYARNIIDFCILMINKTFCD